MKRTICYGFIVVACSLFFLACTNEVEPTEVPDVSSKNKTVLAYVVGDINLWYMLEESINQMEQGWDDELDGNLIVYLDKSPHMTQFPSPVLLKIRHDETDRIVSEVVKYYPDQDAADKNVMRRVLSDVAEMYPAESQGLIIATHGSGSEPGSIDTSDPHDKKSQSRVIVGPDRYGSMLEIYDLAEALPVHYEFILFHACLMANVETAYALKDKCDYLVASSESLPGHAYPYHLVTPYLFSVPGADWYKFIRTSVVYYNAMSDEEYQPLTLSVTRTDRLDALAAAVKPLMARYAADPESFYAGMEQAYRFGEIYAKDPSELSVFFDLRQTILLQVLNPERLDAQEMAFLYALDQAVPLALTSKSWASDKIDIGDLCGLTCYIPYPTAEYDVLNDFYKKHYNWVHAAGIDLLMQ